MPRIRPTKAPVIRSPARRQDNRELDAIGKGDNDWPIGSIFTAAVPTNPHTLLGFGTWVLFATGRGESGELLEITVE